ncbi:MAG: ribbon-helix-helix domain-containing protein [Candidatus Diapherotrites archaeon]|nr:ribbon-helix-helix domain-containing protein [Candidatus Micrarchaeota archaeon]MBU1939856.1 ribbon-helix-helix domain-containing protein [Candidatus Micrarchaeota archaeon]
MEYVSLKLEERVLKEVEKGMKEFHYSTRSDFLRDAIREKLAALDKKREEKRGWEALFAAKGMFKGKGKFKTDEEFHAWRSGEGSGELKKWLNEKHGFNLK